MHVFSNFELNPVLEIAKIWKARIHVAYAAAEFELKQPQQQHRDQLELLLEGIKYRMDQVPLSGKVSDAITQYAQEIDAKLIALPRHRHGLIEKLTRESVVSRIAYSSTSALLVLPQMG
jgi:nucleotide-binding universal stress UspA family protein